MWLEAHGVRRMPGSDGVANPRSALTAKLTAIIADTRRTTADVGGLGFSNFDRERTSAHVDGRQKRETIRREALDWLLRFCWVPRCEYRCRPRRALDFYLHTVKLIK